MDILNNLKNTLKVNTCTFAKKFASASIVLLLFLILPYSVSAIDYINRGTGYSGTSNDGWTNLPVYDSNNIYYKNGSSSNVSVDNTYNVAITGFKVKSPFSGIHKTIKPNETLCIHMPQYFQFAYVPTSFDSVSSSYDLSKYKNIIDTNTLFLNNSNFTFDFVKYDIFTNIDYKIIASDIYFKITSTNENDFDLSTINYMLIRLIENTSTTPTYEETLASPYHDLKLSNTALTNQTYFTHIVSCDSVPFVESSSEGGDNKVSNTILLSISIGVFCIFLYLVIRELFRR